MSLLSKRGRESFLPINGNHVDSAELGRNDSRLNSVRHISCYAGAFARRSQVPSLLDRFGTLAAVLLSASPSFCRFGSWVAEVANGGTSSHAHPRQGPQGSQVLQGSRSV